MAQPVLGILTLYMNERKQIEERSIYQKMIAAGKKMGLDVYVFTPQDVHDSQQRIYAMYYHPETGRWSRKWSRFPNMIFDRCRIQRSSRFQQLKQFRSKYSQLLFLNRPLRNKWTLYKMLANLAHFKPYLPNTRLYSSVHDIRLLLKQFPILYLKPINGTGGRGILRITRIRARQQLVYVQGRDHQRRIIRARKITLAQLAAKLAYWNAKERYLVQQGIFINLPTGRVHDYRMLVQKNGVGKWTVTGGVGRIGAKKSITSNLHGGGVAVPMQRLLNQWIGNEAQVEAIRKKAELVCLQVALMLEHKYGPLCELALDLAIDRSGHVWLLEVNPKPAREVFFRSGDRDTYQLAIIRPLEYAAWLYKEKSQRTHVPAGETRTGESVKLVISNEHDVLFS